mmetsp:Transcript_46713/g.124005  ORF Transcript_46713/g.124005 Transcript_46713/m.124005 type:complete len:265 (-) Transcript_46713:1038-1832(-)
MEDHRLMCGGMQLPSMGSAMDCEDGIQTRLAEFGVREGCTITLLRRIRGGMPATAPRIKMPANNRMHSSAALRTTDMWSNVIGDEFGKSNDVAQNNMAGKGNTYEMAQNLMALARLSGASKGDAKRGSCKKCGEIGHLSFQCFNTITTKKLQVGDVSSTSSESDNESEVCCHHPSTPLFCSTLHSKVWSVWLVPSSWSNYWRAESMAHGGALTPHPFVLQVSTISSTSSSSAGGGGRSPRANAASSFASRPSGDLGKRSRDEER